MRIATKKDAKYIQNHLRESDIEELTDGGLTLAAVSESFRESQYCRCMCAPDGKPFAMWGCGKIANSEEIGSVWMLATDNLDSHKIAFGRVCASEIKQMQCMFPILTNYVHAKNKKSQKWLKSLGAEISPEHGCFCQFWFFRREAN